MYLMFPSSIRILDYNIGLNWIFDGIFESSTCATSILPAWRTLLLGNAYVACCMNELWSDLSSRCRDSGHNVRWVRWTRFTRPGQTYWRRRNGASLPGHSAALCLVSAGTRSHWWRPGQVACVRCLPRWSHDTVRFSRPW